MVIRQNASQATTLFKKIQQLLPEHLQTVEQLVERLLTAQTRVPLRRSNGQQMSIILSQIAELGGTDITDPVAWQRDIRQERDLFER